MDTVASVRELREIGESIAKRSRKTDWRIGGLEDWRIGVLEVGALERWSVLSLTPEF